MQVINVTGKGQMPFKRKPRHKKQPQLLLRLGILIVGVSCFVLYGYITGKAYTEGIDSGGGLDSSIETERFLLETPEEPLSGINVFQYSEEWVRRNLVEQDRNSSSYNECKDKNVIWPGTGKVGQHKICIGYGGENCKKIPRSDAGYGIVIILLSLLYLFVGIAIVCDELFVPALEIIAEDLELSNDVAGATLMAAGGSAPELATSFVGTFKRSDVGFGTIVGSAVFNVLFVIGMCVMFTPTKYAPLKLTWWPLFRDCSYYILTLSTLAIFMSDGEIEWWESLIQLFMYFGYVGMMSKSPQLEEWLTSKLESMRTPTAAVSPAATNEKNEMDESIEMGSKQIGGGESNADNAPDSSGKANFLKPSTFRVGILQLMTSKIPITETAGIAFVSQIKGDVDIVFDRIDANKNGEIDLKELKQCLLELGTPEEELSDEAVQSIMDDIDKNKNGHANKADFTVWYTRNETRLKTKTKEVFEKYATGVGSDGNSSTISKSQIYKFMAELGHDDTEAVKDQIQETVDKITTDVMTYDQFTEWYFNSMFWEQEKATAEQAADAQESMWQSILSGFDDFAEMPPSAKVSFITLLPLQLICCLIPDCRPPGKEKIAPLTLFASVIMIACFAIVMVEFAETFGQTLGIPDVVMGLTILAAGTSVPDLLSSVIVAQQGEGDMAVSSSIGSNIFDVSFGLPLPWLVYNLVIVAYDCHCWVEVQGDTESLMISLLTLLAMVAAIIVIIHQCEWKMTHALGYAMFFLYFCYLAFALLMTPRNEYVAATCAPFKPLG